MNSTAIFSGIIVAVLIAIIIYLVVINPAHSIIYPARSHPIIHISWSVCILF